MSRQTAEAYRYAIGYPASWWSVDLHPDLRDTEIRKRIVSGLTAAQRAEYAPMILEATRSAKRWAAACHARGARHINGYFELINGEAVAAMTIVVAYTLPDDLQPDLTDLMTGFAIRNSGLPWGKGTAANRTEILDLPNAGPAGRWTSIEELTFEGMEPTRLSVMQTLVPLPGTNELLIVTSATPNIKYTDLFLPLFEQIADSLTLEKVTVDA